MDEKKEEEKKEEIKAAPAEADAAAPADGAKKKKKKKKAAKWTIFTTSQSYQHQPDQFRHNNLQALMYPPGDFFVEISKVIIMNFRHSYF